MQQRVDITTPYDAFLNKLNINMWALLGNVRVNKKANCGGSIIWADVAAICRNKLSRVSLVPLSTMGKGNNTLSENSIQGSIVVSSSNEVRVAALVSQAVSSNFSNIGPL